MTSHSKSPIYYITAKVSYTTNKRDVHVVTWIITRHLDPIDIMLYDDWTMKRLRRKFYGKRKVKERKVTVHEIVTKQILGRENQPKNDKKRPDSSSDEQGSEAVAGEE